MLGQVYGHDAEAREAQLDARGTLLFLQAHQRP